MSVSSDSSKEKLFTDDELASVGDVDTDTGTKTEAEPETVHGSDANTESENADLNSGADTEAETNPNPELDESKLQAIADEFSSLDDDAMAAVVRGMPDESRQALCSAVAGTLSDEQLAQCGLSKGTDMAMDEDEAQLQESMMAAKPEEAAGSLSMSLTSKTAKSGAGTGNDTHPHSLELAQLKASQLLDRARAVHSKNSAVITADQLEGIEAKLQGQRCLSLLKQDCGDLQPIALLVAMGERMVKGDGDADLLEVKTLNMSLTGAADSGQAKPVKMEQSNSMAFDEAEARKMSEERWKQGSAITTPSMK